MKTKDTVELTPKLIEEIANLVAQSVPPKKAASTQGVSDALFDIWMNSIPAFAEAMTRAESVAESDLLLSMHCRAAGGDRIANQFLLQSRFLLGNIETVSADIIAKIMVALSESDQITKSEYQKVLSVMKTIDF